MGRVFLVELEGRAYSCRLCSSKLAFADDVLSRVLFIVLIIKKEKSFNGSQGRAYLFEKAVNVTLGPKEDKMMLSGMHMVKEVFCCCCGQILGWKYVSVTDENQKYKEGKYVIERWRITDEATQEANCDARRVSNVSENA